MFVLLGNMQILLVSCISKDSFLVNESKTISFASGACGREIFKAMQIWNKKEEHFHKLQKLNFNRFEFRPIR